tara:strand:- start:765 stop:1922 length:1158 start_codon:yes stop_codon:yes gene_type:complete
MASTYVNDLRLNELGTGDGSGTWGNTTNTNLELIGEALGFGTEAISTNANTHTSTIADGSTDPARSMYIKYTGALDSDCTITIAPNTISRVHIIENATTDSGSSGPYNIIIKQGSGSTVTIPNGQVAMVYLDGAGSGAKVVNALTNLNATHGQLAIGQDADADDLTGDSAVGRLTLGAGEDLNLYHGGTNSYIVNDTGDLIIDTAGDIQLDAAGNDFKFLAGGTEILNITNSSSDVVIKPVVDAKDIIFQQRDGTAVMTVEDNVSLAINNDVTVAGRAVGTITTVSLGTGSSPDTAECNMAASNDFSITVQSDGCLLSFAGETAGQSGNIHLNNPNGQAITVGAEVAINATALTSIATAGVYQLSYYCIGTGNNEVLVTVSGALT